MQKKLSLLQQGDIIKYELDKDHFEKTRLLQRQRQKLGGPKLYVSKEMKDEYNQVETQKIFQEIHKGKKIPPSVIRPSDTMTSVAGVAATSKTSADAKATKRNENQIPQSNFARRVPQQGSTNFAKGAPQQARSNGAPKNQNFMAQSAGYAGSMNETLFQQRKFIVPDVTDFNTNIKGPAKQFILSENAREYWGGGARRLSAQSASAQGSFMENPAMQNTHTSMNGTRRSRSGAQNRLLKMSNSSLSFN
jgi:hypothetical protein